MAKRKGYRGYRFAVAWVAENDNAGNGDDLAAIAGYVSTLLVADMFGKEPGAVARDIYRYRYASGLISNDDVQNGLEGLVRKGKGKA